MTARPRATTLPFPTLANRHTLGDCELLLGDSLQVLQTLPQNSFDLVLTDPPYCAANRSGSTRGGTSKKYTSTSAVHQFEDFAGDSRDQRSFQLWVMTWAGMALRLTRPGGAFIAFIDYRNVAAMIDAVQAAGWTYDGLVPWVKPRNRPRRGWFRTSGCEYLVCCSNGVLSPTENVYGPAAFQISAPASRIHPTQKPTDLLRQIMTMRPDWQRVLDPFAGGASTLAAAMECGRSAVGIECVESIYDRAVARLNGTAAAAA